MASAWGLPNATSPLGSAAPEAIWADQQQADGSILTVKIAPSDIVGLASNSFVGAPSTMSTADGGNAYTYSGMAGFITGSATDILMITASGQPGLDQSGDTAVSSS